MSRRYAEYLSVLGGLHGQVLETPELPGDARLLSYLVAAAVVAGLPDRQRFLEEPTTDARLALLIALVTS